MTLHFCLTTNTTIMMRTPRNVTLLFVLMTTTLLSWLPRSNGFCMLPLQPSFVSLPSSSSSSSSSSDTTRMTSTSLFATRDKADNKDQGVSFLLKDFLFYNGQVLDPYQTLKVPRQADARAIKQAYRRQSRLCTSNALVPTMISMKNSSLKSFTDTFLLLMQTIPMPPDIATFCPARATIKNKCGNNGNASIGRMIYCRTRRVDANTIATRPSPIPLGPCDEPPSTRLGRA